MYIQVRIYDDHDYDILVYDSVPFYKLDDLIHACLCAYVRGQPFQLPLISDKSKVEVKKSKRICITFDEQKDADVIQWLRSIKNGRQNLLIKLITRLYIPKENIQRVFFDDTDTATDGAITVPALAAAQQKTTKKTANKTASDDYNMPVSLPINNAETNDINEDTSLHSSDIKAQAASTPESEPIYDEPAFPNSDDLSEENDQNNKSSNNEESAFDLFEGLGDGLMI